MRAPFQDGRLPRAGEVRLPQRRRRRARARRRCSGARSSASTRTRPPTWCPAEAVAVVPGRRAARRGRCSPARWRPRSTRCGTPHRWSATGSPSSAPAWSGCCVARLLGPDSRRPRSPWSTSTPPGPTSPPRSGSTSPRPADAAGGRDLVVHASATVRRAAAVAGPARARGHGARPELVRRRRGAAVARRRVPLRAAGHPRQPGRHGVAGPPRARGPPRDRLALALDLLRDPAFDALLTGSSPLRRAARRDGPAGRADGCRRCATPITYGEG